MRRLAGVILLLLLASEAAAADSFAQLTSSRILVEGTSSVEGSLVAFGLSSAPLQGEATPAIQFTLEAQSIKVQIDHRDTNQTVASVGVSPGYWSEEFTLTNPRMSVSGQGIRPDLFAVPAGDVSTAIVGRSSGAQTAISASQSQKLYLQPEGRLPLQATTSRTVGWTASDARLTMRGDFTVAIWDLDLLDETSETLIETGVKTRPIVADPTNTVRGVEEWHEAQAYLQVHDGTMDILLESLGPEQVFLAQSELRGEEKVTLHDTLGLLMAREGPVAIQNETVTMWGGVALQIGAHDARVLSVLAPLAPGGASVGSEPLRLVAAPQGFVIPLWFWAIATVLAALIVVKGRQRWQLRSLERAEEAMERGDFQAVSRIPSSVLRSSRHAADAAVLRVAAALRLGKLGEAEQMLENWPSKAFPWDHDFLHAHLLALQGNSASARRALEACLAQAPNMKAAALQNPLLAPLVPAARPPVREGYS